MNRKMLLAPFIVILMLLAVAPVMASQPKVWDEKNNDKFETFNVLGRASLSASAAGDWQYIPSEEKPNKIVVSWDEVMTSHVITIDGVHTYTLGTDFTYEGHQVVTLYDPVINPPPVPINVYALIASARMVHMKVDYMYDFSAVPGGIEGTLRMQGILKEGVFSISSLSGTGDLQNVQIKATSMPQSGTYNFAHNGIVIGWPV